MPIHDIQIKEYECSWCGYKWINRVNGKDGPIPERCAKCKRWNWNEGEAEKISPEENGLKRRIKGFEKLYKYVEYYWTEYLSHPPKYVTIDWPAGLTEIFLNLKPRPTIRELIRVVYPQGLAMRALTSQNQYTHRGCVPDPEKPGWLKYDREEHIKIRQEEAQKRIELMIEIMKSRGVQYDLAEGIRKTQQAKERKRKTY
jgi:hypothetical protein